MHAAICRKFRAAQLRDDRATAKACRAVINELKAAGHDSEYIQAELILRKLIPDCRVKPRKRVAA